MFLYRSGADITEYVSLLERPNIRDRRICGPSSSACYSLVSSIGVHGVDCDDKPEEKEKKEKAPNVKIKIADSPASRITPLSSLYVFS